MQQFTNAIIIHNDISAQPSRRRAAKNYWLPAITARMAEMAITAPRQTSTAKSTFLFHQTYIHV